MKTVTEILAAWPHEPVDAPAAALQALVDEGAATLPFPGEGQTLARFGALAAVAARDLSLVKLYEGHTDALAILHELRGPTLDAQSTVGVWAAEMRGARVMIAAQDERSERVTITGRKAWCSGAADVSHALLTAWTDDPRPQLVLVPLRAPGVRVTDEGFHGVGMARSGTVEVCFEGAEARLVGGPGDYLTRPGFWQGAVGVAACWYGGALGLAETLRRRATQGDDAFVRAHLGAVDAALGGARAALREAATAIDAAPTRSAHALALRTRAVVESAVDETLQHVGRALGAAPFCRDGSFARRAADLPVFLRQSHAERDLASLGALVAEAGADAWAL